MKRVIITLLTFGFLALISGSFNYRFRGEEPRRAVIAYEMNYFNNFYQPTFLGENYYRKPPLFNWLIILSSKFSGWGIHTGRIVSITFTFLTTMLLIYFSFRFIFRNIDLSLISGLIFLSFLDISFWYGFLAEIDITLTFFVFLTITILMLSFEKKSYVLLTLSGVLTGLSFLLKGFPSYVFFSISYAVLAIWHYFFYKNRNIGFFIYGLVISLLFSLLPIILWLYHLNEPVLYLKTLWDESFNRVKESKNIIHLVSHVLFYPLLNIKQTLLVSLLVLVISLKEKKVVFQNVPSKIKLIGLLFLANYLPYLISASSGRYILPILPLLAVIFTYIIYKTKTFRAIIIIIFLVFTIRLLAGVFYFPYETAKKGKCRFIAQTILSKITIENNTATNCKEHKGLIFFLDTLSNNIVLSENKLKNWKYFISCNKKKEGFKLIDRIKFKNTIIYLYAK